MPSGSCRSCDSAKGNAACQEADSRVSLLVTAEGEVVTTIENFSHRNAQIKVGETLVWTNMDAVPHTVTLGSRGVAGLGFDSGLMGPGQSFALKFDQLGTYSFTCTLHPSMNGEIEVTQ